MTLKRKLAKTADVIERCLRILEPPPDLNIADWADRYLYLSSEGSAEPGKYYVDRAPYQREPMECLTDRSISEMLLVWASQTGKTQIINNIAGYYIDQDPGPIMIVQSTKELAESWSKDRLAPMVRDTPVLRGKIDIQKQRVGQNTTLHKKFPGGHITIAGANSPSSLASRPIKVLMLDEIDRYKKSAGKEGDPVNLAVKRTDTFWNKKIVKISSPGTKGESRIWPDWERSDQRRYHVPCPHCGEEQLLKWSQVRWDKNEAGDHLPDTAYYVCEQNGCIIILDAEKPRMLKAGRWVPRHPGRKVRGYHINTLYSPWKKLSEMVTDWLNAKDLPDTLQTFVNTSLAELWEANMEGETLDQETIAARREDYLGAPDGVLVITAAVDVQDNRLEVELLGWGEKEENWSIDYRVIYGDPETREVWSDLDNIVFDRVQHASGVTMPVSIVTVDSGGHHTQAVYDYCKRKAREKRRVFPLKGHSQPGQPLINRPTRPNSEGVFLFMVGTDTAKDRIYSRLREIAAPGPGYSHFPDHYDDEYFEQLTSEKKVKRMRKGRETTEWEPMRKRNEALDVRVYNHAALAILKPNFPKLKENLQRRIEKMGNPAPAEKRDNEEKHPRRRRRKGGGFVSRGMMHG